MAVHYKVSARRKALIPDAKPPEPTRGEEISNRIDITWRWNKRLAARKITAFIAFSRHIGRNIQAAFLWTGRAIQLNYRRIISAFKKVSFGFQNSIKSVGTVTQATGRALSATNATAFTKFKLIASNLLHILSVAGRGLWRVISSIARIIAIIPSRIASAIWWFNDAVGVILLLAIKFVWRGGQGLTAIIFSGLSSFIKTLWGLFKRSILAINKSIQLISNFTAKAVAKNNAFIWSGINSIASLIWSAIRKLASLIVAALSFVTRAGKSIKLKTSAVSKSSADIAAHGLKNSSDLAAQGMTSSAKFASAIYQQLAKITRITLTSFKYVIRQIVFILLAPVRVARQIGRLLYFIASIAVAISRTLMVFLLILVRLLGEAIIWLLRSANEHMKLVRRYIRHIMARVPVVRTAYALMVVSLATIIASTMINKEPTADMSAETEVEIQYDSYTESAAQADKERRLLTPSQPIPDIPATIKSEAIIAPNVSIDRRIPDPTAIEPTEPNNLPAWQLYAAIPSNEISDAPKLVIVIDDLGLSMRASKRLETIQGPLSLAFLPYANRLVEQTSKLRTAGHELMVHMPMEPHGNGDPGYNALVSQLSVEDFTARLDWNLSRFDGFVGINNHMGSSLTENKVAMELVMEVLQKRGLLFLDSLTTPQSRAYDAAVNNQVPALKRDVFLDNERDPALIWAQLRLAENIAMRTGAAIAIGHPYPETLQVLDEWTKSLDGSGVQLVSLSALMKEERRRNTRLAEAQ